ncbi:hypothetical protein SAMN05216410_3116 [Sanguibacter gelidistatuariae]|uniref:Uncharacterized protein n=1 Tax=Sanguibacter gelidistatuariae TaxID=1814289 RepID=A0A1G6TI32_9MICO|nr:hypothetical protein [Sanguibacter gelidistatuariae]SDD28679.1 hypothetical protein SAMN05216410_3116 [Sanguibacter gelidistatuariae]
MRLESSDGTAFDLSLLRYQFGTSGMRLDWDANWLVVAATIALPDSRSWSFVDPCLATWEARELEGWFRGVLSGIVEPAPFVGGDDEHLLSFTEPNLAVSLARRDADSVTIRVHLSLEAEPPWLTGYADGGDLYSYFVEISSSLNDLASATEAWALDVAAFPER